MLPIQRDAHRRIVKTSGRLELQVMHLASEIAEQQRCHEVTAEHVRVATLSLANENAHLWASLVESEEVNRAQRAAG